MYKYEYKPKKSKFNKLKFRKFLEKNKFLLIGVLVLIIIFTVVYFVPFAPSPLTIISDLSTTDYKKVSVDATIVNGDGIVILTSGCYRIIAYVENYQANSILMALNNITPPRPNAHDIAADSFKILGIDLLMVKVTELRDNTFYGKIILRSGNKVASLDARPSDATAIAIRMGAPIFVKEDLLKEYGEYFC